MGLTLHYRLKHSTGTSAVARQLVERLRQRALDLPFQQVEPLIELTGDDCDFQKRPRDDPHHWLLIQARESVKHEPYQYDVRPTHLIAFNTDPGDGCEPANFGLCRYPASIQIEDREVRPPRTRRLRTGLSGWSWRSFCKAQYASNPDCGGVANFLRCHLLVVRMLDCARELGILEDVSDEGNYWQKRDVPALAREVGEWNEMIAAQMGQLKDLLGDGVQGAILKFPDYEHLEAIGSR